MARRGDDLDRVDGRVDEPALLLDVLGLAHEPQRHGDGDLLVEVDLDEVDVGDVAAHRVALQVLDDRRVDGAVDGEVEHGVHAGGAGQGEAQLTTLDGDRQRRHAVAVEHARDCAGRPQAASRRATRCAADLSDRERLP